MTKGCAARGEGAHIGLEVSDLFAQELFYRTILGFSTLYRYASRNTPGLRTVMLRRGNVDLELLHRGKERLGGNAGAWGHAALGVRDVDAEYERLRGLGLAGLVRPRDTGDGFRECSFCDPEGNRIELFARVRPFTPPAIAAAIFDLDGTLVDSEPNYYEADRRLLAAYGVTLTPAMKRRYVGVSNLAMAEDVRERFGIAENAATLVERKMAIYRELARADTPVFPEISALVRALAGRGLPLAVASGSPADVVATILGNTGLAEYFGVVVSADEAGRPKPDPAVFTEAARRLGTEADRCVVFEDSAIGVEAALRAGMRCVAIPTAPDAPLDPRFEMADILYADGMPSFSAASVLSRLDASST